MTFAANPHIRIVPIHFLLLARVNLSRHKAQALSAARRSPGPDNAVRKARPGWTTTAGGTEYPPFMRKARLQSADIFSVADPRRWPFTCTNGPHGPEIRVPSPNKSENGDSGDPMHSSPARDFRGPSPRLRTRICIRSHRLQGVHFIAAPG
jgi:hypothetical protein